MKKITKQLVEKFKTYLINEEKSSATLEKYIRDVLAFMEWLADTILDNYNYYIIYSVIGTKLRKNI